MRTLFVLAVIAVCAVMAWVVYTQEAPAVATGDIHPIPALRLPGAPA